MSWPAKCISYIFILICYSILVTVNTYVLLAADMADFRSIAEKFGPSNFAEQIEDLVQDKYGGDRDEQSDRTAEYSDDMQSQSQVVQSYEVTTERPNYNFQTAPSTPYSNQNRYALKSAPSMVPLAGAAPLSAPGLNLDDIVERVKQKLQEELLNRNANRVKDQVQNVQVVNTEIVSTPEPAPPPKVSALRRPVKNRIKKTFKLTGADSPLQDPVYETPVNVVKEEVQYETTYEEPDTKFYQGMDIQSQPALPNQANKKKIKPKGVMKKIRYVKQVVVAGKADTEAANPTATNDTSPTPEIKTTTGPKTESRRQRLHRQKLMKKKRLIRVSGQTTPHTPATVNDEAVNENVDHAGAAPGIFEAVDLGKSNDSYEDYVTPAKEEAFESDGADTAATVPTAVIADKFKVTPSAPTAETFAIEMDPLAEEVEETVGQGEVEEYADESPETTTIEPKAKTETISFEEGETPADPNATTIAEVTEEGKSTKKIKMGTMIPTREFYKQSSPNYYAKLPTIAEKYNFQEPIPEADRVPENLKPIGSPPSVINGKAILV